ncbi:MAG: NADH-quinone oxidoreductase subunit NuoE [Lutispora sp.]|nr:NADH-quinone oxidoreductase subunit NuoE [Lutispora sp.]MDD4833143.1 NADH-quinone oxidoreductase subunit NuoE [Lutispora sp.]
MNNNKCCCAERSHYFDKFDKILAMYEGKESDLIPILQDLQEAYGYLPQDVLDELCNRTGMHPTQVMGVITFYSQFRLLPTGQNLIKLCFGTACHVKGSDKIAEALKEELKIEIGETTKDNKFTLETVACLGCCGLAPVMMIGDDVYGKLVPKDVPKILEKYR